MPALNRWVLGCPARPLKRTKLTEADSVPLRNVDWLIKGYLPRGKYLLLAGAPAHGKSTIGCAFAARVSQGGSHPSWPDPTPTPRGNVVIVCTEDAFGDTVLPRLKAAGADLRRVYHVEGTIELGVFRSFKFSESDITSLMWAVQRIGGVDLIIIDPVLVAMSGDSTKNWRVQDALERLTRLAESLNCAILGIAHVTKFAKGQDALARVAGPIAMAGVPRGMMLAVKVTPASTDEQDSYVLVRTKASNTTSGGGYVYRIVPTIVSGQVETSKVEWGRPLEGSAEEILAGVEHTHSPDGHRAQDRAMAFLVLCLQHGPVPYPEICIQATKMGFSIATLKRAAASLGVVSRKQSGAGQFSSFAWELPAGKDGG